MPGAYPKIRPLRGPEPKNYVEKWPFGLCLGVLGNYFTYFWGPGGMEGILGLRKSYAGEATHLTSSRWSQVRQGLGVVPAVEA